MNVVIFGLEDCAELAYFYLTKDSHYKPIAFSVDSKYITEDTKAGLPVVPFEEVEKQFDPDHNAFFAPIYNNLLRSIKAAEIKAKGYKLINYISSKATVWSDAIGENCFVMENNVIQPFVTIGNNVIIWSGNHIGHHSVIGDNVFISSHVVISGHSIIKDFAWLGVNSSIRDHVTIEKDTFIGMGSVVTGDTQGGVYFGNPAKCREKK